MVGAELTQLEEWTRSLLMKEEILNNIPLAVRRLFNGLVALQSAAG